MQAGESKDGFPRYLPIREVCRGWGASVLPNCVKPFGKGMSNILAEVFRNHTIIDTGEAAALF